MWCVGQSPCNQTAAWLHQLRTATLSGATNVKTGSLPNPTAYHSAGPEHHLAFDGAESCGVSFQALASDARSPLPSTRGANVYVKVIKNHFETFLLGESHLREVIASALDRVIGTSVVMPAVGRIVSLPLTHPASRDTESHIVSGTRCVRHAGGGFNAAVMLAAPGVVTVEPFTNQLWADFENAGGYQIFSYVAACYRSPHDHYTFLPPGTWRGSPPSRRAWVAIDNDRCFTDESLSHRRQVTDSKGGVFGAPDECAHWRAGRHWPVWRYPAAKPIIAAFLGELEADELAADLLNVVHRVPSESGCTSQAHDTTGCPPHRTLTAEETGRRGAAEGSLLQQLDRRLSRLLHYGHSCAKHEAQTASPEALQRGNRLN